MKDITSILDRFRAIRERYARYRIKDVEELQWRPEVEVRRRLAPCERNEHLVGLEDDVKKLLEPIMDEENKGLSVSAVVGMGGIGKSTLAREVYNHPDVVSGRFDCRAWVVVSHVFSRQEIIKQLILETTISKQEKEQMLRKIKQLEEEELPRDMYLQRKLEELLHSRLEGQTYFIVLDDVWKMEHYDFLMSVFPKEQEISSRLLLTTRDGVIASHCQNLHVMKLLDPEKSWELFMKESLVFNSNEEFPKSLEQIGRHVVKKCEGLPLSIAMMGGLLAKTRSSREWEEALNQLESHMGIAATTISAILELSYQNLSSELKSCFLCLDFFCKEDVTIPVKRLLNIMVGQGLIQQTESSTAEEIARGYLDEMINWNMVQIKDLTLDNRVKNCHLHNFYRNICLEKSKEEMHLKMSPHHRVEQCNNLGAFSKKQNQLIRSLFLTNVGEDFMEIDSSYCKSFQNLMILDLELAHDYDLQRLPDSLQLLIGLKQLRVGKKSVKILPQHSEFVLRPLKLSIWLNALKQLELLDLRTQLVEFPNVGLEIDSLRHIHANGILRLILTNSQKNVETLKYVKQEDWMRSSLSQMDDCQIRELGIVLDHESSSVIASLEKLGNLVKLCLMWRYRLPADAQIIPNHSNLTKLKLGGLITKYPSLSTLTPNLSHLTLEETDLRANFIQELSKLPKLLYLNFKTFSYRGERMKVSHDGFAASDAWP